MYGSVEQAFVGRDEPKNGCEGGYVWRSNLAALELSALDFFLKLFCFLLELKSLQRKSLTLESAGQLLGRCICKGLSRGVQVWLWRKVNRSTVFS